MPISLSCQILLDQYSDAWQLAIAHPFLEQSQQGTIQPDQFNTWLVQDYYFVVEFTRMAARLLAVAPFTHFDVLLSGLGAIKDELHWFHAKAAERSIDLNVEPQATCKKYCQFMQDLAEQPYAVQATAFWAIERAYNQAWHNHSPMPEPYGEFANRWGNPEFTNYVELLAQQADAVLQSANAAVQSQATAIFLEVARLEKDFWQMAFDVA